MCFFSKDSQTYPSWAHQQTPHVHLRRFRFLLVLLLGGLHSRICHLFAISGLVNSPSSVSTTLIRHFSTAVSYTLSLQILSEIFCKMHKRYTKLHLLFVKQSFLFYLTKNIKFQKCLYPFIRFFVFCSSTFVGMFTCFCGGLRSPYVKWLSLFLILSLLVKYQLCNIL